jgi:methionyl-tRNA formyltransferase
MKLKIVFYGTPFFVVPVLEALTADFDVVGIVTTPDVPLGRKKVLTGTPIKLAYEKYLAQTGKKGIIITQQVNKDAVAQLRNLQPDLFVVAAYGHLIPKSVLDIPKYGSLNIHPSLLPKYRGPSPIQTAILNGDSTTGVSIIKMDEEIDHGPLLIKKELPIENADTFQSLHIKLFTFASEMLTRVIPEYISGTLQPNEQQHDQATYCEHITREDGRISLANPPDKKKLDHMIRAYYPWPSVWTKARIKNQESRIIKFLPGKRIQLEGGKPMMIKDFMNGYPELGEKIKGLFE